MFNALKGARTYICAFLIILAAGLHYYGVLDADTFTLVVTLLGGTGLAALRAAAPTK